MDSLRRGVEVLDIPEVFLASDQQHRDRDLDHRALGHQPLVSLHSLLHRDRPSAVDAIVTMPLGHVEPQLLASSVGSKVTLGVSVPI